MAKRKKTKNLSAGDNNAENLYPRDLSAGDLSPVESTSQQKVSKPKYRRIRIFTGTIRLGVVIPAETSSDDERVIARKLVEGIISDLKNKIDLPVFDIELD